MTTLVLNVGLALVWLSGALVGAAVVLGAQRERARRIIAESEQPE